MRSLVILLLGLVFYRCKMNKRRPRLVAALELWPQLQLDEVNSSRGVYSSKYGIIQAVFDKVHCTLASDPRLFLGVSES